VDAQFKHFQFTIKVTSRIFNDEQKLNFVCVKAVPLPSWDRDNRQLMRRLELY
jgi:hypothetical protein